MPDNLHDVVVDSARERAKTASIAKRWLGTLMGHHWNEMGRIERAAAAKGLGLDERQYATPYTQHNVTITNMAGGVLRGAFAAVAAAAIGAVAMWLWNGWVPEKPDKPPIETIIDKTKDLGVEYDAQLIPPNDD